MMNRIIIHHSATEDGASFSWRAIRHYHLSWAYKGRIITEAEAKALIAAHKNVKPPYSDVGYHAGIELLGTEYECLYGRPTTKNGAHTRGENGDSLGFCFVGDYDVVEPDPGMLIVAAKRVLAPWCVEHHIDPGEIDGHRKYANKTCPGKLFNIDELRCVVEAALAG